MCKDSFLACCHYHFFGLLQTRWILQNVLPWAIRWFLFGFGFQWIHTVGKPCSVQTAPIIVSAPHTSYFDSYLLSLRGVPSCVAKQEMKKLPLIGRKYTTCQCIYTDFYMYKCLNRIAVLNKNSILTQNNES